jgi:hypothetical protein
VMNPLREAEIECEPKLLAESGSSGGGKAKTI